MAVIAVTTLPNLNQLKRDFIPASEASEVLYAQSIVFCLSILLIKVFIQPSEVSIVPKKLIDRTDALLLLALAEEPRATVLALAARAGVSRNTAQARLARIEHLSALASMDRRIEPAALGYPLTAFVMVQVTQRKLDDLAESLEHIPEIVEVHGLAGQTDLLVRVIAADAEHLYRIAGQILATPGVERTTTALAMHTLVSYRLGPLLRRIVSSGEGENASDPG